VVESIHASHRCRCYAVSRVVIGIDSSRDCRDAGGEYGQGVPVCTEPSKRQPTITRQGRTPVSWLSLAVPLASEPTPGVFPQLGLEYGA
jgi:hypothetical protein